jgi:hypothetical protein
MSDASISHDAILSDPSRRRFWLIYKASEHSPLAEALVLARAAEEFLMGGSGEFNPTTSLPELSLASVVHLDDSPSQPEVEETSGLAQIDSIASTLPEAGDVQVDETPSTAFDAVVSVVGADEVVRFLRQRDDVVVQTGDGAFMVNGRFRETLEELVERANRIRARQCLPRFVTLSAQTAMPAGKSAEGAPMNGYRSI